MLCLTSAFWQMDVFHVTSFGRVQFVHVSVDSCYHTVYSLFSQGGYQHTVVHCLASFAFLGYLQHFMIDSNHAYTFSALKNICAQHKYMDIPYSPQGQAIIERFHRWLKQQLEKQKREVLHPF